MVVQQSEMIEMRRLVFVIHYKIIFTHKLVQFAPPVALDESRNDSREHFPASITFDFE